MDSLTHAFAIALLLIATGNALFVPFAVVGAVLPDIDFIFLLASDGDPSLYIFTHGGFTHSLLGATLISIIAFFALRFLAEIGSFHEKLPSKVTPAVFLFILAGAFLHLFLDYLAYPGIPMLYPLTEQKYTLGILPGPSLVLLALSTIFLVLLIRRKITIARMGAYAGIFIILLIFCAGTKGYVELNTQGTTVPTLNPFSWLVINENETAYSVQNYDVFHGVTNVAIYDKYTNITPSEVLKCEKVPGVQRLKYYSYIITVEKNDTAIIFHDPLREQRIIFYPRYHPNFTVHLQEPNCS